MDVVVMETDNGPRLMCAWFAMCDRPAEWSAQGLPDQGMVPVCQRCADRVGLTADELYPYELDMPSDEDDDEEEARWWRAIADSLVRED